MKRIILTLILVLTLLTTVSAVVEPEEIPTGLFEEVDLSGELEPLLQSLVDTIRPLLKKVSIMVGGIFGLYLILILARVHYERKKVKLLKDIRYDLDNLNMHYDLPYSKTRKGFLRRLFSKKEEPPKKAKKKKSKK